MARKKKGGGDVGEGANWMDTYGDMVTLLLAFFVLLFSFSTIDAEKWEALVGSLSGTGTSIIQTLDIQSVVQAPIQLEINTQLTRDPHTPENPYNKGNAEQELNDFLALVNSLQEFIEKHELDADLIPEQESLTVILRINDNIFFDSGDATIKESSYSLLESLAVLFSDNMDIIDKVTIEGHTDTDPISTGQYEDNWDLSSKRATNTVRFLLDSADIEKDKMKPIGLSEYHPIDTNDTPEGKARNRRVDFVIESRSSTLR